MTRKTTIELEYIRKLYAPQDALLDSIDAQLETLGTPMQIEPEIGRLLQVLIGMTGVKKIVEIGSLAGSSAIWMARGLPEDGHIYTINKDAVHIRLATENFAQSDVAQRITLVQGDAHDALPTLNDKAPFDMVFIDADKISYNDYLDWAEEHVKKGGLIIADNTTLNGKLAHELPQERVAPTTWHNMRRFNERLADKTRYNATLIPTQSGLTVAHKLF